MKIVENVNELYDMWNDLKVDEVPKEPSQETENGKVMTVNM